METAGEVGKASMTTLEVNIKEELNSPFPGISKGAYVAFKFNLEDICSIAL